MITAFRRRRPASLPAVTVAATVAAAGWTRRLASSSAPAALAAAASSTLLRQPTRRNLLPLPPTHAAASFVEARLAFLATPSLPGHFYSSVPQPASSSVVNNASPPPPSTQKLDHKEKDKDKDLLLKQETPVEKAIREVKEELQLEQKKLSEGVAPASSPAATPVERGDAVPSATAAPQAQPKSEKPAITALSKEQAQSAVASVAPEPSRSVTPAAEPIVAVKAVPKPGLLARIRDEALHYWDGLKLLGAETSISTRLIFKLLRSGTLSRRENRQLRRTVSDLLRLVPFVIIVVVPFLELALPFLLYLFPNMLPSTFESKSQQEAKKQKLLKVRLEMAKFLQETVSEVSVSGSSKAQNAKEFSEFFSNYRDSGLQAPTDDVLRVAKKFGNELTLNNLSRPQLISIARYMNLSAFGTDAYLRRQIDAQLELIKADDIQILREGVESLTLTEVQQACQARGIRTVGVSPARLRSDLSQWLELHVRMNVPSVILILSRAFVISDRIPSTEEEALKGSAGALQATLSSLPEEVVSEASLHVAEVAGTATHQQRLSVLKQQEELIKDELAEEQKPAAVAATESVSAKGVEATPSLSEASAVKETAEEDDEPISEEQLKELGEAIKTIASEAAVADVKEQLSELKEDVEEYKEDLQELEQLTKKPPSRAALSVSDRVTRMIDRIEAELAAQDAKSRASAATSATAGGAAAAAGGSQTAGPSATAATDGAALKPDADGRVPVEALEEALRFLRDHPKDERVLRVVRRLDTDGDGLVSIGEILAVCDAAALAAAPDVPPPPPPSKAAAAPAPAASALPKDPPAPPAPQQ
ncbi:hypothetical protein HK405_003009 [Cladochytrium tenue]|nr:hypothetical protein HK405_003009 [Cladochytrium tenue]